MQENGSNNVGKFIVAHDFLLSSSDSSDFEELQYIYLMQKKKIPRVKHYIRNVVDQYTDEQVN